MKLKEKELASVSGGADVPMFENPVCTKCGKPASFVTISYYRNGVGAEEKCVLCMDCVETRTKELAAEGITVSGVQAVL